jgi:uncharacterized membrane protein HdeD (DUF308 family)
VLYFTSLSNYSSRGFERAGAVLRMVQSQPGWITRLAALVIVIVIGLPIFLLVTFALFAGAFVFAVLALVNGLAMKIRGGLRRQDGRENVRVIQRGEW